MVDPLVVTYVASHPNSAVVLAHLWPLNRDLLLRAMVALWQKDASNVARVLDVCQVGAPSASASVVCDQHVAGMQEARAGCACCATLAAWCDVQCECGLVLLCRRRAACWAGSRWCTAAASPARTLHYPPLDLQELKGLTVVLDATPAPFCLELAALAARREYLNLEK